MRYKQKLISFSFFRGGGGGGGGCFGFFGFSFYSRRKVTSSQGFCTHFPVKDLSSWGGRR